MVWWKRQKIYEVFFPFQIHFAYYHRWKLTLAIFWNIYVLSWVPQKNKSLTQGLHADNLFWGYGKAEIRKDKQPIRKWLIELDTSVDNWGWSHCGPCQEPFRMHFRFISSRPSQGFTFFSCKMRVCTFHTF